MTQSVYGILAQAPAQTTSSSSSVKAGGGGFASYLSAALGANSSAGIQAQAASSGQYNPLPSRSLVSPFSAPVAMAPEHSGQFKALDWPGAYRPEAGQEDVIEASGLPEAISTYGGGYFNQEVSLSPAQTVGGGIFQFHFPHIIEKDGTYYAYFIDHSQGSLNDVGLATSSDGTNWNYQGKVLTKGGQGIDAREASFPAVQYDSDTGKWYMLYEATADQEDLNTVCLATSDDGRNWEKQGPVIKPGQAGDISAVDVGTPTMFKENGVWNVYFHTLAKDGRVRMGYARGADLQNLTVQKGALLDVDSQGLESGTVGARSNVVKVGPYYYMAYEVCTANPDFGQAQWGTNLARSTRPDGGWQKLAGGPLVENPQQGFGYDGPELSIQDGRLYLYYRTAGNTTARREISGLDDLGDGSQTSLRQAHQPFDLNPLPARG
ncbi:MAG: hypothetical protein HY910_10400 [Desulfarculus sp.]|nr:hypothetical protein [Desulfarculus sp.]